MVSHHYIPVHYSPELGQSFIRVPRSDGHGDSYDACLFPFEEVKDRPYICLVDRDEVSASDTGFRVDFRDVIPRLRYAVAHAPMMMERASNYVAIVASQNYLQFLECMEGTTFRIDYAEAIQQIRGARKIEQAWYDAQSNPYTVFGKRKLLREFEELVREM